MSSILDRWRSAKRPGLKNIFISFISIHVIIIACIVCIPILLHIGTYGVHRIVVSHAKHLGHISAPPRKILMWSDAFSNYEMPPSTLDKFHVYENCHVPCSASRDRDYLNTSNAVVIHVSDLAHMEEVPDLHTLDNMPQHHVASQYKVLFNDEVRFMHHLARLKANGQFHVALNSLPKHLVIEKSSEETGVPPVKDYLEGKNKFAIMLVSTPDEYTHYQEYLDIFKEHFEVDVYHEDSHHNQCIPLSKVNEEPTFTEHCLELLASYKFIFLPNSAFEEHYVTDRIRMTYISKVVPVLLDISPDYSQILPNSSFMDINSYRAPDELAKDMIDVGQDGTRYDAYFEWVNHYDLYETKLEEEICELCAYIRQLDRTRRSKIEN